MNSRSHLQPFLNNSLSIRQEIQRFESVHPSIYAIYDLIDLVPDGLVAQQIRDHVVCIEDSFVNSQEWTLSRSVPDLRLGIVGSLSSGKSALVHRYLTGSYMQEESPEGGRFKKEILVDNQSHLLLIRDEGGQPELQFTAWVDAVIFVFSLENESSFNAIYNYYTKMSHFRNPAEVPLILVGTQDAISENNPRVIDDARARKLAADLKRCSYYETCATYGLNVERVFQDACSRIVQQRVLLAHPATGLTPTNSRPSTPNFNPSNRHPSITTGNGYATAASVLGTQNTPQIAIPQQQHTSPGHVNNHTLQQTVLKDSSATNNLCTNMAARQIHTLSSSTHHLHRNNSSDPKDGQNAAYLRNDDRWMSSQSTIASQNSSQSQQNMPQQQNVVTHQLTENNNVAKFAAPLPAADNNGVSSNKDSKDLPTPSSTPTTSRKSRRRSNLFTPSKKGDDKLKNGADIGSGRAIPIKQGHLYKRSSKVYRDWKKKYVTLCDNGVLTYHASLHDYMDDAPGKRIPLHCVTVKIPGRRQPKGSKAIIGKEGGLSEGMGGLTIASKDKRLTEKVLLTAYDIVKEPGLKYSQASGDEGMVLSNSNSFLNGDSIKTTTNTDTSNIKKRHRRMKSSGVKNSEYDDPDEYEFQIVSLDNKQWHFEASSSEERDEWVAAIEQQILISLQLNESSKAKKQNNPAEAASIQSIRTRVPGNGFCVDCDAPNPDWASLNLGVLMCIECSGIHRNLGSHISRVRSLDLDEWPPGHLAVMLAIGNHLSNSIYEHTLPTSPTTTPKPSATSPRDHKELYIRRKYLQRDYINQSLAAPTANGQLLSPGQQLVDAVCAGDIERIVGVLVRVGGTEEVNEVVGRGDKRTALHLACAMGGLAVVQLLIWHKANINAVDQDGRTCLVYARAASALAVAKFDHAPTEQHAQAVTSSRHLVELLQAHGCPDSGASLIPPGGSSSGTLPRRRATGSVSSVSNGSTGIGNGTIVTSSVV